MANNKYIDNDIDDDDVVVNNTNEATQTNEVMDDIEIPKKFEDMIKNMDLKEMQKFLSKMNIDQNKLKAMADRMTNKNESEKTDKPLTREELRKKLKEKTKMLSMKRSNDTLKQQFIDKQKNI